MDTTNKLYRILLITLLWLSSLISAEAMARPSYWYTVFKPSLDAGLMVGYTGGPRRGTIVNPATTGSAVESGSQDSSEFGAQMRLLFGNENCYRPFIYLNGAKTVGAPMSILFGRILPPFTLSTKMSLTTNWLARLGIGASTPWMYDTFQLGIGVAAVMLNQTLETQLGQTTVSTFSQNKTSLRPSLMGSVTWCVCRNYLMGHEGLLTAQITADSHPVINQTVTSDIGPLNTRVNQAWVPRGDLVFSIKLF